MEKELKLWELRGQLVFVTRKTRAKFPDHKRPAPQDFVYLVVSTWESPTTRIQKLALIDKNGKEYGTTIKCIELIETCLSDKWKTLKAEWDERNSIPVVARCIEYSRKLKGRDKPHGAYFKLLNGKGFTLTKNSVAKWPEDLEKGKVSTVWLTMWKAKRIGLIKS